MAAKFFINGGVNSNWNSTSNWSTTSGGTGGAAVPSAVDAVTFDIHSPNCIINVTANVSSLTFTNYTNTITINNPLHSSTFVTLGSGMSFAGSSTLGMNSTSTQILTSNGKSVDVPFVVTPGNGILSISGNCTFNQSFTIISNGNSLTINGSSIILNSNLIINNTKDILGTATLVFAGNTTLTNLNHVGISNNITITGNLNTNSVLYYGFMISTSGTAGTLTYTSGIITNVITIVSNCSINTNSSVSFPELDFYTGTNSLATSLNVNLTSVLYANLIYVTLNNSNATYTLNFLGSFGFNVKNWTIDSTTTIVLMSSIQYTISNHWIAQGNIDRTGLSDYVTLSSSTPGTQSILIIQQGTIQDMMFMTITDIDSSLGATVWNYGGTISNTKNWKILGDTQSPKIKSVVN